MPSNPPAALTRDESLRNNVVRLECPSELEDGTWDGPIYARLREPRHIQPGHPSVFVVDDSERRPGWLCQLIFYTSEYDGALDRLHDLAALGQNPVVIPFARLTRPYEDLSSELSDRPLLLLFRFVRFSTCFLLNGPRAYTEVQLDVFLTGQVVAYFPSQAASFRTETGAVLRPTSKHVCIVAVRAKADATPGHVVIPSDIARSQQISRDEFIMGWCHGVAATAQPARRLSRFRSRWEELVLPDDSNSVIDRLLRDTFVPPGSDSTIDPASTPIRVISEYGRIVDVIPITYARAHVGPSRPTTRLDSDADSDLESPSDLLAVGFSRGRPVPSRLPDILRYDDRLSALPLLWRRAPLQTQAVEPTGSEPPSNRSTASNGRTTAAPSISVTERPPDAHRSTDTTPGEPVPTPVSAMSENVFAVIADLARSTQAALAQQAAAQQSFQEQLLSRLASTTSAPQRGHAEPSTEGHRTDRPNDNHVRDNHRRRRERSASPPSRSRETRRSRSVDRLEHRGRSASPSSRSRAARRSRSRDRREQHGRSRNRSRDRDHRWLSGGHHISTGRSDELRRGGASPVRQPLHHSHGSRRQNYGHDGSPRYAMALPPARPGPGTAGDDIFSPLRIDRHRSEFGYGSPRTEPSARQTTRRPDRDDRPRRAGMLSSIDMHAFDYGHHPELPMELTGTAGFRPSPAELRVHQTARVGPRPNGEFVESNLFSFWQLSALDRVSFILHEEMRRGEYRATKVTSKMIFAIDFGTRPIDHFLPPSAQSDGGRTVVPDSSTWASGDTVPGGTIETMADLRATLQCLREVATEWYPVEVVNVFAEVHADASARALDNAPVGLVHAMVNLYTHVFSRLFMSINQQAPPASLVNGARAIMAQDSPDYTRIVRQVINRGLFSTWAQVQAVDNRRPDPNPARPRQNRSRHGAPVSSQPRHQQRSPVPDHVARQIPVHEGKTVCLKFQTRASCSYRRCKFFHGLERLPNEVVTYTTDKYGPLATGHPNESA